MNKLNNRGITTIELILCFVLVFIMAFSMYGTVSSYNDKRVIEKDKNEILSYKYLLTKTIQDDFVNNELSHVSIDNINDPSGKKTYILHCTLKNGVKKELKVEQTLGYSTYNPSGLKNQSDSFMISYGTEGDLIEYPLPNLGSSIVKADPANGISEHTVQELSIQNVRIEVLEHQVLSIQIVFYHPSFGNEYGISIMAPVNYVPDINLPLNSYTLLYDDNGGSGCSDKSILKMEDDYWGTLCTPNRSAHQFLGWNTKPDGTGTTITEDSIVNNNITVYAKWRPYQLKVRYNGNEGTWNGNNTIFEVDASGNVLQSSEIFEQKINYGTTKDLYNANNSDAIKFTKDGYHTNDNEAWIASNGKKFDQNYSYSAETLAMDGAGCNLSQGDCIVNLKVNWTPYVVKIRYNGNGGTWNSTNTAFKTDSSGNVLNSAGTIFEQKLKYGESDNLYDHNNTSAISFRKIGRHGTPKEEWIAPATGKKFNQATNYSAETYAMDGANCDLKTSDCEVRLLTNWIMNVITLRFKSQIPDGETITSCNDAYAINSEGFIINKSNNNYIEVKRTYNTNLGENGLPDYHNSSSVCFQRDWYTADADTAWYLNGNKLSQQKDYNINDILNLSTCDKYNDCTINLTVYWRVTKINNIYSCNGGKVISGPSVPQNIVGNTGNNCDTRSVLNNAAPGFLATDGIADHNPVTSKGYGTILMERAGYSATQYYHVGSPTGPLLDEMQPFSSHRAYIQEIDKLTSGNYYNTLKQKDVDIHLYAGWKKN